MTRLYSKQRARRAVFHTLLLRPPGQLASFVGYVLLVRLLSEAEYGVYSLFYALLPLLAAVASFGLEHTLRRYQPEYLKQGENRVADRLVRRIGLIRLVSTAVVLALLYVTWPQVAPLFDIEGYRSVFVIFAGLALAHFQCSILTIALSSHLLQQHSLGMQVLFAIVKAVLYAAAGYGWGLDLVTVFLIDLAAYLFLYAGLKYLYTVRADRRSGTRDTLPPGDRRRIFKYGIFYNFNDAGTLPLRTRTDNFFIAAYLDPVAVGAYSFCTQLSQTIYRATPLKQLESVVRPLFFSLDYEKNVERVRTYFSLLVTFGFVVMVPIFLFIACWHREVVQVLFAGKFLEHAPLLTIVFLFAAANSLDVPITLVAQLKEKAHVILASRIFSVYNVVALIVLIPRMGIAGAVLASGSAHFMKHLFIWWFVRDLAVWKGAERFIGRTALAWAPFVALSLGGRTLLPFEPAVLLALGAVLWSVAFALYIRHFALTHEQRELIATLFPGKETRFLRAFGVVH
ncbi:MAG TPA: oligosaccharide flippase family protein [Gammaproteobacteria bacterium]